MVLDYQAPKGSKAGKIWKKTNIKPYIHTDKT